MRSRMAEVIRSIPPTTSRAMLMTRLSQKVLLRFTFQARFRAFSMNMNTHVEDQRTMKTQEMRTGGEGSAMGLMLLVRKFREPGKRVAMRIRSRVKSK